MERKTYKLYEIQNAVESFLEKHQAEWDVDYIESQYTHKTEVVINDSVDPCDYWAVLAKLEEETGVPYEILRQHLPWIIKNARRVK